MFASDSESTRRTPPAVRVSIWLGGLVLAAAAAHTTDVLTAAAPPIPPSTSTNPAAISPDVAAGDRLVAFTSHPARRGTGLGGFVVPPPPPRPTTSASASASATSARAATTPEPTAATANDVDINTADTGFTDTANADVADVADSRADDRVGTRVDDRVLFAGLERRYAGSDAVGLLPAYRWRDVGLSVVDESGFDNAPANGFDRLTSSIASLLYSAQAWAWGVLVDLAGFAFDFSLFASSNETASAINDAFVAVADAIVTSGLIFVPIIAAAVSAGRAALRGATGDIVRVLVAAIVPIGMLWAFSTEASDVHNADGVVSTGPVGLAVAVTSNIEHAAMAVGSGFGTLDRGGVDIPAAGDTNPGCGAYIATLYDGYDALRSTGATQSAGAQILPNVSRLWERALLNNWRQAQYGDTAGSWRIFCHHLEANANIDRAEQATIGALSGYPSLDASNIARSLTLSDVHDDLDRPGYVGSPDAASTTRTGIWAADAMVLTAAGTPRSFPAGSPPGTFDARGGRRDPYSTIDRRRGTKAWQASLLMWAACRTAGDGDGLWATEAWRFAGRIDGHHCDVWWNTGLNPGEGRGTPSTVDGAVRAPDAGATKLVWDGPPPSGSVSGRASDLDSPEERVAAYDDSVDDDVDDVRTLVTSMRGDNTTERFWFGMISFITTAAYIYLLGGLAVGTLAAKLLFGLCVVVLPVTLFLVAFTPPSKSRAGSSPSAGWRMVRLTLSMLVASSVLSVVLTFMVFLTDTVEGFVSSASGGGELIGAFVPLIAMIVLWWVMRAVGVANVFNPISLAAAPAAMGAWAAAPTAQRTTAARRVDTATRRSIDVARTRMTAASTAAVGATSRTAARLAGRLSRRSATTRQQPAAAHTTIATTATESSTAHTTPAAGGPRTVITAAAAGSAGSAGSARSAADVNPSTGATITTARSAGGPVADRRATTTERGIMAATPDGDVDARRRRRLNELAALDRIDNNPTERTDREFGWIDDHMNRLRHTHTTPTADDVDSPFTAPYDVDDTARFARHPMHYLDDGVKDMITNSGLTADAQNWVWHALSVTYGWTDPTTGDCVDMPARFGVDLSTSAGRVELAEHLAGRASRLDDVTVDVDVDDVARLVSFAQRRGGANIEIASSDRPSIRVDTHRDADAAAASIAATIDTLDHDPIVVRLRSAATASRLRGELDRLQSEVERLRVDAEHFDVTLAAPLTSDDIDRDSDDDFDDDLDVDGWSARQQATAARLRAVVDDRLARREHVVEQLAAIDLDDIDAVVNALASTSDPTATAIDTLGALVTALGSTIGASNPSATNVATSSAGGGDVDLADLGVGVDSLTGRLSDDIVELLASDVDATTIAAGVAARLDELITAANTAAGAITVDQTAVSSPSASRPSPSAPRSSRQHLRDRIGL